MVLNKTAGLKLRYKKLIEEESYMVNREQCPKCADNGHDRSGDNMVVYSDGHKYCFRCETYVHGNSNTPKEPTPMKTTEFTKYSGSCIDIQDRKVDHKTCRKYNYQIANIGGKEVHISNYYRNGEVVAQHLRGPDKQFKWTGTPRGCELYGQHLFKSNGGKKLVITEGEIDCLTVSQLLGTWPVVSLPNGATSAVKSVKENLEFINSYEEVVLMFDMDDPGKEAARKVAELLPPGRAKIATLPYKDANECVIKGNSKAVVTAFWEAQAYSPDEILHVSDIQDSEDEKQAEVWPFPWDKMSEFFIGQRSGEITLWTSGTGSGKSTILRELIHHHLSDGRSVGAIMLEESPKETIDDMISLILNKPVRAIRASRMMNNLRSKMGKDPIDINIIDDLSDEEYAKAKKDLSSTKLYVYDHLGNNAMANLLARMEFMAISLGVEVIVLDHITAAAAGLMGFTGKDVDGGSSERIIIDTLMKELRSLCARTGVHVDIVSQLKKTDKAYEEGNRITLQDLRGSGALSSVPNTVVALERNRQDPDPVISNTTIVRVLKNRLTGRCGVASALYYDHTTSRLLEKDFAFGDNGEVMFDESANANPFGEGTSIQEDK